MQIEKCLPNLSIWAIKLRSGNLELFLKMIFMLCVRLADLLHIFSSEVLTVIDDSLLLRIISTCMSVFNVIIFTLLMIAFILRARKIKINQTNDDQLPLITDESDLVDLLKQMDEGVCSGILLIYGAIFLLNLMLRLQMQYHFDLTTKSSDQFPFVLVIYVGQSLALFALQASDLIIILGSLLATFSYHCFLSTGHSGDTEMLTHEQSCHLTSFRQLIQSQTKYFTIAIAIDCAVDGLLVIKFLEIKSSQPYQLLILLMVIGNVSSRLILQYWTRGKITRIRKNLEKSLGHSVSSTGEVNKWIALASSRFNESAIMLLTTIFVCAFKHPLLKSFYFTHGRAILGVGKKYLALLDRKND